MAPRADLTAIRQLADKQDGVVSRAQLRRLGATDDWIGHQAATKRWQRLFPGVYLTHSGRPAWPSRARAALLYAGRGAVLSHASAAYRHGLVDRPGDVVHVSVPHGRTVRRQPGLRIHGRRRMPPAWGRLRAIGPIDTVLDVADLPGATADEVVGLVCRAVQRNVDSAQIRKAVERRTGQRHRKLLLDLLAVVDEGIESTLEYRYHRVERSHGLPRSQLQSREVLDGHWLRADCRYVKYGVRIELDGQLAHPFGRTDRDVWRDNAALVLASDLTLRYRWRHVVITPCLVARQVAIALRSRGWSGAPRPCGPGCAVGGLSRP
ncbi:type IV toxin-antitoxin system AbiEi family antitoxin domain-containing protein [Georgenia yuyongxinii]